MVFTGFISNNKCTFCSIFSLVYSIVMRFLNVFSGYPDEAFRGQKYWRDFTALSHLFISLVFYYLVFITLLNTLNRALFICLGQNKLFMTINYHTMFTLFCGLLSCFRLALGPRVKSPVSLPL